MAQALSIGGEGDILWKTATFKRKCRVSAIEKWQW